MKISIGSAMERDVDDAVGRNAVYLGRDRGVKPVTLMMLSHDTRAANDVVKRILIAVSVILFSKQNDREMEVLRVDEEQFLPPHV